MNPASENLVQANCVPCRAGEPTLTDGEIAVLRLSVPDWIVVERDGIKRLERVFMLRNFAGPARFTSQLAELADSQGHHPAVLTEWGRVTVSWWTHAIKGLHRNDFIMAAKTDALFASGPAAPTYVGASSGAQVPAPIIVALVAIVFVSIVIGAFGGDILSLTIVIAYMVALGTVALFLLFYLMIWLWQKKVIRRYMSDR